MRCPFQTRRSHIKAVVLYIVEEKVNGDRGCATNKATRIWHKNQKKNLENQLRFNIFLAFLGSYYFNLRKCKRKNLRKVLGWFSNPPVYCRAQVFAATCNCTVIYHYHQYHTWVKYDPVFSPHCLGDKAPQCNRIITTDTFKWLRKIVINSDKKYIYVINSDKYICR